MIINNVLSYDIETIPEEVSELTSTQTEQIQKKLDRYLKAHPEEVVNKESIRNMLMATNPLFGRIVCIGLTYLSGENVREVGLVGEEKDILASWWNEIKSYSGTFVSFNGLEFDAPYIMTRSMKYSIAPTNKNFCSLQRFQRYPHYDVMQWACNWDRFKSSGLKTLCDFLGIPSPKEGEVAAENVYSAYKDGQIDKIKEYCLKDTKATLQIYNKLKKYTVR